MKCALTAQNLLSLQQLSFIYRPLIGWPCVNTHMVQHMSVHTSSPQIHHPGQFFSPLSHPSKWSNAVGTSSCSGPGKANLSYPHHVSAFLVWHPVLSASLCTLQMLSFAEDISPTGVSPVSITSEESFPANSSVWLHLSLTLALWGEQIMDLHQPVVSFRFQATWTKSVNQSDFGLLCVS